MNTNNSFDNNENDNYSSMKIAANSRDLTSGRLRMIAPNAIYIVSIPH